MSVSTRAVTTAVLAALVAAASYVQPRPLPLVAAVVVLVVLVALGWPSLLRLPAAGSTRVVVALCGTGGAAATYLTQGEPVLRHLPTVLAGAVVLSFIAQMLRRDGRPQLTESVSGTVAGVVAAIATSGWIAAARSDAGATLVVTSAVALAVAAAVSALPVRGWVALGISAVAAVLVGGAAATLLPDIDTVSGLWCGLVAGHRRRCAAPAAGTVARPRCTARRARGERAARRGLRHLRVRRGPDGHPLTRPRPRQTAQD